MQQIHILLFLDSFCTYVCIHRSGCISLKPVSLEDAALYMALGHCSEELVGAIWCSL